MLRNNRPCRVCQIKQLKSDIQKLKSQLYTITKAHEQLIQDFRDMTEMLDDKKGLNTN